MDRASRSDLYLRISQDLDDKECRDLRDDVKGRALLPARDLQHMNPHGICLGLQNRNVLKTGDLSVLEGLMRKVGKHEFAEEAKKIAAREKEAAGSQDSDGQASGVPEPRSPTKRQRVTELPHYSAEDTTTDTTSQPKRRQQGKAVPEATDPIADESDGKIKVKVATCTEDFCNQIVNEKDPYRMSSIPRGHALIVNNTTFKTLPYRKGGDVDLSNIKNLLEGLSFQTHIKKERTAQEITDDVLAFSQLNHRQMDCCVVVLMSHGDEGVIYGTDDNPVALDDIFAMFDNVKCPRLRGKPKLFFIQACRGPKVDNGAAATEDEADSSGTNVKPDLKIEMRKLLHISAPGEDETDAPGPEVKPTRTDMLCGYATQLGFKSFRNRENGSWFIQAITKVFMEHAKDTSLVDMMTKVIDDLSKRTANCPRDPVHHEGKEEAEFLYKLHKPLYFFPGIE